MSTSEGQIAFRLIPCYVWRDNSFWAPAVIVHPVIPVGHVRALLANDHKVRTPYIGE